MREQDTGCLASLLGFCDYLTIVAMLAGFSCRCAVLAGTLDERSIDPFYYLFGLFLLPFALMMLAAKRDWMTVAKYLLVLKSMSGRGCFQVMLGLVMFEEGHPADITLSVFITTIGIANLVVAWLIPCVMHFKFLHKD